MKIARNILVALVLMTAVWRLDASTVIALNFEELSRASDVVVAGEVVSIATDLDDNGYVHSTVVLHVAEAVPADLIGSDYIFRMIGGEYDGRSTYIEGMPQFAVGDGLILFLNDSPDSPLGPTVGLWQGVFHIGEDSGVSDSEKQMVVGVQESRLVRAAPPAASDGTGAAASQLNARRAMSVGSFMDAVRQARSQ